MSGKLHMQDLCLDLCRCTVIMPWDYSHQKLQNDFQEFFLLFLFTDL